MAKLVPNHIVSDVRTVLSSRIKKPEDTPLFLTAHQILRRLPDHIQAALAADYPGPHYKPANAVADAAEILEGWGEVQIVRWLDTDGLLVGDAAAGSPVAAIYRLGSVPQNSTI